ncbi:MAG: riboflavin synthase, partial [bacterium]
WKVIEMFTGLIQKTGKLAGMKRRGEGARIEVSHSEWDDQLSLGESVAVQGVCLTVACVRAGGCEFDVLRETLDRTSLGGKARGAPLNLERALRASDRIGGHFVTGHVDGVGTVSKVKQESQDWVLEIRCPDELLMSVCIKGSVACDGVSLTVVTVTDRSFGVRLIPFTWENTSLQFLDQGSPVNIETDILEKYVRHRRDPERDGTVSIETLQNAGFAL